MSLSNNIGNYADTQSKIKKDYNCTTKRTMSKDF